MINMNNEKKVNYNFITLLIIVVFAIVAIVGTTYAFLSATFVAGDNTINGSTYKFDVTLAIDPIKNDDLVPVEDNLVISFLNSDNPCVDVLGHAACSIYKLTLTNRGHAQALNGYLQTRSTTYTTNHLKHGIYTKSGNTYTLISDTKNTAMETNTQNNFTLNSSNITFNLSDGTSSSVTSEYYLVMWLSDIGSNQLEDQNKTYAGSVTFKSTGGNTISATF